MKFQNHCFNYIDTQRAIVEKLNYKELKKLARSIQNTTGKPPGSIPFPDAVRGNHHTYTLIHPSRVGLSGNALVVD